LPPRQQVYLIHGNDAEKVSSARYELLRKLLPHGEEDGESVDIRSPSSQPLTLEKAASQIAEEVGAVSLIPDARKVVWVWDLADFKAAGGAKKPAAKKAAKSSRRASAKADPQAVLDGLEATLREVLPETNNAVVFLYSEDDEKGRRLSKTAPLYELVRRLGAVQEFSEKRIDWAFEEAMLAGNATAATKLLGEWMDRGGNSSFRLVTTLNGVLQLLLQARLEAEAQARGDASRTLFPADMRPGLGSVPEFKATKARRLAQQIPASRLRAALARLNQVQKSFFPTGEELVVHDAVEIAEALIVDLLASPAEA
jgi:hypothetical protein